MRALPDKPDHNALELSVLEFWDSTEIFEKVRAKNAHGPRFSFIDGPVTANKTLAVHTAWGRTLKDVFQRYKALRGFDQRYQNGFDCQGLWIEVGVEKELGLNSKREIEEYGLEPFARKCREVVEHYAKELTKGSVRLGQWMDWGRDYFTSSDTNIEYIWRFLKIVHERGWLYKGHRSTEWCPRCGTSISAHELIGNYVEREDPSLTVRFPLLEREGQAIVIWTTTPWTLPANVAVAVRPDAQYGRLANGDWVAVDRAQGESFEEVVLGSELAGWRYQGPFDHLGPGAGVAHRIVEWDEVSMEDGTGAVHIAPGCGSEDFELSRSEDLAVLTPVDESGRFYPDYGWLAGRAAHEAAEEITEDLRKRELLVDAATISHRYPECWRCHTPLIFRISDDWFISVDEIREPMRKANRAVEWTPDYFGKRMDDWLVNMADWNISRRRYYGLPLPFYPCSCGHLTVIGSRDELRERAGSELEGLEELRRPWIDSVQVACAECGDPVQRVVEVGDVWLDAGIVPFSTLGWDNGEWRVGGYGTGAAKGLTTADLPNHAYWEKWFPADLVTEMREQIRLWFYSQLFMSVALTGRAPYKKVLGYEKMLDETGREMHGSWGNMIEAEDAFARMGADVMRWQFCAQPPNQNLLFGFGPAQEIQRKLLTLWNSTAFFVQYANIEKFVPQLDDLTEAPGKDAALLDRWLFARTGQLVAEATEGFEQYMTVNVLRSFETYVNDLSNWYVRRSRRRFWNGEEAALRALWSSLVQALRVIAPVMPFLAEHLWQTLVVEPINDAPKSVFLAGWPEIGEPDTELLQEVAVVRTVVGLGRQARVASQLRVRQPLRRLMVEGAQLAPQFIDEVADELRVKEIEFAPIEATDLRVRPNLPVLGPRLGKDIGALRKALEAGEFEVLENGGFRVAGHDLSADEVLVEQTSKPGWAVASEGGVTVALDTSLDDELILEGRVYDTIHRVNTLRKEAGMELTDRIHLHLPSENTDLLVYRDRIMAETLAVTLEADSDGDVLIQIADPGHDEAPKVAGNE
ncbi:MAG TPA: isoleucine--tRNA ligase [Acidimicrobiales bacterium]|nr:isoleucine--tRNA ligase [Acidimicrobiales bacterium]